VQRANHFFSVPPKKHRSAKSSLILPTPVEYRCFQRGARMLRGETAEATAGVASSITQISWAFNASTNTSAERRSCSSGVGSLSNGSVGPLLAGSSLSRMADANPKRNYLRRIPYDGTFANRADIRAQACPCHSTSRNSWMLGDAATSRPRIASGPAADIQGYS